MANKDRSYAYSFFLFVFFNAGMHWEISSWLGLMGSEWHALWSVLENKCAEIHTNDRVDGNPRCSMIAAIGYITRVTSAAAAVTAGTPWKISEHVFPRLVCQCETVILLQRLSLGNGSCLSSHPKKAAILLTKHTLKHTFTPTCIDTKYLLSQHTLSNVQKP